MRQHSDPLGQGGTFGDSYNRFALSMNGSTNSVLSNADVYGTALQGLTNQVRERLSRSFSIEGVKSGQMIRNVWHRRAGQTDWGAAVDHKLWTQSGSSVTLQPDVDLQLQDEFRFEYW